MHYLNNKLTFAWAFLCIITIASWWLAKSDSADLHIAPFVSISVLVIASIKVQLVIHYFMEVGTAPVWLKNTTRGWLLGLFLLLVVSYSL